MTVTGLKQQFNNELQELYPQTEVDSFFLLLAEEYLQKTRLDLALDPNFKISEETQIKFHTAIQELKQFVPIQYIIGHTEFFGLPFKVDKNVLIPRPETEELVEWILSDISSEVKTLKILDIGTGSGCIPISLASKLPDAEVTSYDITEAALKVAEHNAEKNSVAVKFEKIDILKLPSIEENFDVIVSNPPYVRELEKAEMQKNVLDHEPEQALYVSNEDALIFYRKITELAAENLQKDGLLYFEINQYLASETLELVENYGFKGELRKDIFGNYRMLKGIKI